MAETTADVRRDIEMTRERISTTLAQLERKTNVVQIVKDNPWPALAAALGVGVLLSGSRADVKAAAATAAATKGASSRIGGVLDGVVANLMGGVHQAFQGKMDSLIGEIRQSIGAPATPASGGQLGSGNSGGARAPLMGSVPSPASTGPESAGGAWAPQTADAMSTPAGGMLPTAGNGLASSGGQGYQPTRAD